MSGDVGIEIQDYECVFGTVKYEVIFVMLRIGSYATEHTALLLGINT